METLKTLLNDEDVRGAVRCADGSLCLFRKKGVADLFQLLHDNPGALRGAVVCDRVVGCGAAWLMIKGQIREVFASLMSQPAYKLLRRYGIITSCDQLAPAILNHAGNDTCPVEILTAEANDPDTAYELIDGFINNKN